MKTVLLVLVTFLAQSSLSNAEEEVMRVHIIDVGQAVAALVEFPNGVILIDAGGETSPEFTLQVTMPPTTALRTSYFS